MTKKTKRKIPFQTRDTYCRKILLILTLFGEKIRFNELNELLSDNKIFISKPTLSLHLKHLAQDKLVNRNVEEVQNVSYEINHKKLGALESNVKSAFRERTTDDKKAFDSASIDEQMDYLFLEAAGRILQKLKLKIEQRSEAALTFEKSMQLMLLSSPFYEHYEEWLLEKSEKDEEYRVKILEKINELIMKTVRS